VKRRKFKYDGAGAVQAASHNSLGRHAILF
jgi:hypothetical protein